MIDKNNKTLNQSCLQASCLTQNKIQCSHTHKISVSDKKCFHCYHVTGHPTPSLTSMITPRCSDWKILQHLRIFSLVIFIHYTTKSHDEMKLSPLSFVSICQACVRTSPLATHQKKESSPHIEKDLEDFQMKFFSAVVLIRDSLPYTIMTAASAKSATFIWFSNWNQKETSTIKTQRSEQLVNLIFSLLITHRRLNFMFFSICLRHRHIDWASCPAIELLSTNNCQLVAHHAAMHLHISPQGYSELEWLCDTWRLWFVCKIRAFSLLLSH